ASPDKKTPWASPPAAKADKQKTTLWAGYPQVKIDSFNRQKKEPLARQAENTPPPPMLAKTAAARGVELAVLIEKVVKKPARLA
ncbi:hypothetical protein CWI53_09930, partial [Neisseria meningitidis]